MIGFGTFSAFSLGLSILVLRPRWLESLLYAAALIVSSMDAVMISIPLTAALTVIAIPGCSRAALVIGSIAASGLILAKFSVFPVAFFVLMMADAVLVWERRIPIGILTFAVATYVSFVLLGGAPSGFIDFLKYSFETSVGYVPAMATWGNWRELLLFLIFTLILLVVIALQELREDNRSRFRGSALVLVLFVYLFTAYKVGFVRHDFWHSVTAWSGLALTASLYLCARSASLRLGLPFATIGGVSFGAVTLSVAIFATGINIPWYQIVRGKLFSSITSVQSLTMMLADTDEWVRRKLLERDAAWAAVRMHAPLPALAGSVDIIPSDQARVIASGLDYRPRFTIQEYTSYTPALIAKNSAYFRGPDAPRNVIFAPGSIDGRHPASAEGALWPDLLRRYQPAGLTGDLLILSKRNKPVPGILAELAEFATAVGQPFIIPDGVIFLKLQIRTSYFGHLLAALFKPPALYLRVRLRNGSEYTYRLIPGQAEAGFFVSPLISSSHEFIELLGGAIPSFAAREVASARLETGSLGRLAYRREVFGSTQILNLKILKDVADSNELIRAEQLRRSRLELFLQNITLNPPTVDISSEGLFAHAPSKITIPISSSSLLVQFGIRAGAYQSGGTDGVCFHASTGAGAVLWERCLDPKRVDADRGTQSATVPIPSGTSAVVLETSCRTNCAYAWSYWSAAYPGEQAGPSLK